MNIKQHFPWLLFIGTAIILTLVLQKNIAQTAPTTVTSFGTEKAQKRPIISLIKAKGILIPQEIITIGNLINGIIRALYVKENDLVDEGQLIAEIDDSRDDADLNANFGNLDSTQAVLSYQLEFLKRQQELFARKQISLDALQQAERDYEAAYAKVEFAKGLYEQAKLNYDNKQVRAPVHGMIIAKNVSVGQAVSNFSPATVIYSIAKNITTLKAHIFLEINTLEVLQTNTPALMTLDTYPHKTFTGIITEITGIPHEMELTDYTYERLIPKTEKIDHHCAIVPVDNSDLRLRPGMTFNAQIIAAEKDNVLSVPSKTFNITKQTMQQLAAHLHYDYQPLDAKKLLEIASSNTAKTIWLYKYKAFIEKVVTVGINDTDYIEIVDGLDGSEEIVCSVA